MTRRKDLSARQIDALIERLRARLAGMLPDTQPEVAARLLELVEDPEAGPADFAEVVRHDPTLSGKLLRAANSAMFAQRSPVTTVERACVLLGLQRIRALALGFYLAKNAQAGPPDLSRRIWGESVFRACLASTLGVACVPGSSAEAFLIGLMLDTGIPLLRQLSGPAYDKVLEASSTPGDLYRNEMEVMPCTHIDVVGALCRSWELPDILRKPIERHHQRPPIGKDATTQTRLHQIAFIVGELDLRIIDDQVEPPQSLSPEASQILAMDGERLKQSVDLAAAEYATLIDVFGEVAEKIPNLDAIRESGHIQLAHAADRLARDSYLQEARHQPATFMFAGGRVQVDVGKGLGAVAYLVDGQGDAIVSYAFDPARESANTILDALGLDLSEHDELKPFEDFLARIAA